MKVLVKTLTVLVVVTVFLCVLILTLWLLPSREFLMLPMILPIVFVPAAALGYAAVMALEFNPVLAKDRIWVLKFHYRVVIFSLLGLIAYFGPLGLLVSGPAFILLKILRAATKKRRAV